MDINELTIRIVEKEEETDFQELMAQYHYLGSLPKIGETLWYAASIQEAWVALLVFSVSALKISARDKWIGWDYRHQTGRLKLVVNNHRFLILPRTQLPNLGSKALSLCLKRLSHDWSNRFGHPVVLVETFVDPQRFRGTVYKASNWKYIGDTRGFSRNKRAYEYTGNRKMIFVKELVRHTQRVLSQPILKESLNMGKIKMELRAKHMKALPDFFSNITDPRRAEGKRHHIKTVLAIATAAVLCGMKGYKGISDWAKGLGKKARQRFDCRYENGKYIVPSESAIRRVLIRVDPEQLDESFRQWNAKYAAEDESLAIDGKTMCNAIDENGRQTHIMGAVGHETLQCYTQKKWV